MNINPKFFSIVTLFLFLTVFSGCNSSKDTIFYENTDLTPVAGSVLISENTSDPEEEKEDVIFVSIQGCVYTPGVYKLPAGSRVYELINLAGGVSERADTSDINMVFELADGMQIYIPSVAAMEGDGYIVSEDLTGAAENTAGLVNINTADLSSLTTLPGIGETRAKAIIEYRDNVGSFEKIEDIMKVSGIKSGVFESIKDRICVK